MSQRKITRRRLLTVAGIAGAGLLACGGLGTWALREQPIDFAQLDCEKEGQVENRILIAYASRCGSTGEVAEAIGQVFCEAGAAVDVRRAKEVKDLSPYRAVVLGTAIRMGKPLSEALDFAQRHRAGLAQAPLALFSLGTTMNSDTLENRAKAIAALEPLIQVKQPLRVGLFGGKVDPAKMEPIWRFFMSFVKEGEMAPGDYRDWDAIRAWADSLIPVLLKA